MRLVSGPARHTTTSYVATTDVRRLRRTGAMRDAATRGRGRLQHRVSDCWTGSCKRSMVVVVHLTRSRLSPNVIQHVGTWFFLAPCRGAQSLSTRPAAVLSSSERARVL
jgi:hypothetical protein